MAKVVKGFITHDDFIENSPNTVAPIYDLSTYSRTFSKDILTYTSSTNAKKSIHVFKLEEAVGLTQQEADDIIDIETRFTSYLNTSGLTNKSSIIAGFINSNNANYPSLALDSLDYMDTISYNGSNYPAFIIFKFTSGLEAVIYLSDTHFQEVYHDYEVSIVTPFEDFETYFNNINEMIIRIQGFDFVTFTDRIEANKNKFPSTVDRVIKLQYVAPGNNFNSYIYFGFNIYGLAGNYDFVLRLALYQYLDSLNTLNVPTDELFPDLLDINEFFVIPRWDNIAIPSQVGQNAIYSQITKTYPSSPDLNKFIKLPNYDDTYFINNTYNVPVEFNNMLLQVVNGVNNDIEHDDFKQLYSDLISTSTLDPDFSRMTTETQQMLTMVDNAIAIVDSDSEIELVTKLVEDTTYNFRIIERGGVNYVSVNHDGLQFYFLPKYVFHTLNTTSAV